MRALPLLAQALLVPVLAGSAHARPGNPERYPVGARQAGMGGAGIADGETPWFNPAGVGAAKQTGLSASLSAYGLTRESARLVDGSLGVGNVVGDVATTTLDVFPASVEYVQPLGTLGPLHHGIGLSVIVPDYAQFQGALETSAEGVELDIQARQTARNQTFWLGAAWGACAERLCLGAGPTGAVLLRDAVNNTTLFISQEGQPVLDVASSRHTELVVGSLGGQVGLQWSPLESLGFGLTVRSPMYTVGSSGSLLAINSQVIDGASFIDRVEVKNPKQEFRVPWRFGLGVTWAPSERWRVAADVRLHLAQGEVVTIAGPNGERTLPPEVPGRTVDDPARAIDVSEAFRLQTTVNGNLGVQYRLSDKLRLQAGVFTDLSSSPDADVLENAADQVNRISGTLGGGWKGETVETWVSVVYAEGWGQVAGFGDELEPVLAPLRSRSIYVMVGSWANL